MEKETKFWAIVELFGHTVLAGQVSKCEIADFVQINIPGVGIIPPWSKMMNPKAIYGINPCTEADAKNKAEALKAMPINQWDTEQMFNNRFSEMEQQGKIKKLETTEQEVFEGFDVDDDYSENDDFGYEG